MLPKKCFNATLANVSAMLCERETGKLARKKIAFIHKYDMKLKYKITWNLKFWKLFGFTICWLYLIINNFKNGLV